MYWGHLGHFHRAISHLVWYKIVCMRYLACTFSQMKSISMFKMFLQSGVPRHFLWRFIAVWTYNLTVFMCICMSMLTPISSGNMQKHWYLGCFHAASARENISGVWVIVSQMRAPLGGLIYCHEPAESYDRLRKMLYVFNIRRNIF